MRGELLVTGSISPTIVLKRTMANNRLTPESEMRMREVTLTVLRRTEAQLLSRVRGQSEAQDCHGSDQEARHDEIEEVVESSPADLDDVCDV